MHEIEFIIVNQKRSIRKEAAEWFARHDEYADSPRDYHNDLIIHEKKVFASFKDASDYMDNNLVRWDYEDHAIPFHDSRNLKDSRKLQDLKSRVKKNSDFKTEYISKNKVQNRKSKSITCPCCDSRITISYLRGQNCPVCDTDLRSPTVLNRIKKFDDDDKSLRKAIEEESRKNSKKAPIKWLVKVEAHC